MRVNKLMIPEWDYEVKDQNPGKNERSMTPAGRLAMLLSRASLFFLTLSSSCKNRYIQTSLVCDKARVQCENKVSTYHHHEYIVEEILEWLHQLHGYLGELLYFYA